MSENEHEKKLAFLADAVREGVNKKNLVADQSIKF